VQELKQFGVNFLKIYTYLPRRLYLAIADEANEAGIPFAGHVPFFVSAKEAAEMGQRSIEHLYGILLASSTQEDELREAYQHKLSYIFAVDLEAAKSFDERKAQELYATFVKQGTHLVPTLVTFHNLLSPLEPSRVKYAPTAVQKAWMDYQQKGKQGLEMSRSNIGPLYKIYHNVVHDMNEAGVPLMAGTDTLWHELEPIPNQVFGFSLHDELALLVETGLTPLEALQAATITPAGFLGIADQTGSVEEGKWADLVLLEQNPLEDITHTREISAVVVDGQMLDKEALQTMIKTFPAPESNQSKRDK
jgi:imidazolonepropionase-like amidohydrolase